jgi:hypothetical protein
MPASSLPRTAAVVVETSMGETQTDWDTNATEIYVIDPDVTGIQQAALDSANIIPRRLAPHRKIYGLKSESAFSCGMYLHAKGANAAEAAAATAAIQHTLIKACIGGLDLGWAQGFAGGTASAPTLEADPGYVGGDFGFAYDTSSGTGEFIRIESIATVTLTMLWNLGFTPDGGGADVLHAVIDCYPNGDALDNHADANHITLGWKVQGSDTEDVYELRGCKPALGEIGIAAGEPVQVSLEHSVIEWAASTPAATAWSSAPSGEAPNVPGIGTTTTIKVGDFAGALATVKPRGTITFTPGITHKQDKGPGGQEGVNGHVAEIEPATLEMMVEYDSDWDDDWEAKTLSHCLIQVGNTPTTAWGMYFPRLEMIEKPQRVDEGGLVSHRLIWRCLEDTASISGLSGDNIDKRRAPFHLLFAA